MEKAKIVEFLTRLSRTYYEIGDVNRSTSFSNAAASINGFSSEIISSAKEIAHLRMIGPSTVKEVQQFIETGTSDRLTRLEEENGHAVSSMEKLNSAISVLQKLGGIKEPE